MTNPPYPGATPDQLSHSLVREFLGVHNMFRQQLAAMLTFVQEILADDPQWTKPETRRRFNGLVNTSGQYTHWLHFHHNIETSTMFPKLQAEGLDMAVVERLNREHDQLSALIDKFNDVLQQGSAVLPETLTQDLQQLSQLLQDHLLYEESHVCPLLAGLSSWSFH